MPATKMLTKASETIILVPWTNKCNNILEYALDYCGEQSLSYYERSIECKIDIKNITQPNIIHAFANSAGDVFLQIIIFF